MGNPIAGTYNAKRVALNYGGLPLTGIGPGDDAIRVKFNAEDWGFESGADGWGVRWAINDDSAIIEIDFMANSPVIAQLNAFALLDKATGVGAKPFTLVNLNALADGAGAAQAWIRKKPDRSYGVKPGIITYEIFCTALIPTNAPIIGTPAGN